MKRLLGNKEFVPSSPAIRQRVASQFGKSEVREEADALSNIQGKLQC
jgi:hypothetical protein